MFTPQNEPFTCTNYNATTEKHGDKDIKVGDLKIEMAQANTILDAFGPDYRPFLYSKANERKVKRDKDKPEQTELMPSDGLTALSHPHLEALRLAEKFPGYTLAIETELGLTAPLEFKEVTLSAFVFNAMEGGTVRLTFNARVKPSPEQSGALHFLSKEQGRITLTPPGAAPVQADIEGGDTLDQQDAAEAA